MRFFLPLGLSLLISSADAQVVLEESGSFVLGNDFPIRVGEAAFSAFPNPMEAKEAYYFSNRDSLHLCRVTENRHEELHLATGEFLRLTVSGDSFVVSWFDELRRGVLNNPDSLSRRQVPKHTRCFAVGGDLVLVNDFPFVQAREPDILYNRRVKFFKLNGNTPEVLDSFSIPLNDHMIQGAFGEQLIAVNESYVVLADKFSSRLFVLDNQLMPLDTLLFSLPDLHRWKKRAEQELSEQPFNPVHLKQHLHAFRRDELANAFQLKKIFFLDSLQLCSVFMGDGYTRLVVTDLRLGLPVGYSFLDSEPPFLKYSQEVYPIRGRFTWFGLEAEGESLQWVASGHEIRLGDRQEFLFADETLCEGCLTQNYGGIIYFRFSTEVERLVRVKTFAKKFPKALPVGIQRDLFEGAALIRNKPVEGEPRDWFRKPEPSPPAHAK